MVDGSSHGSSPGADRESFGSVCLSVINMALVLAL